MSALRRLARRVAAVVALLLLAPAAEAHDVRPAFLQLRETGPGTIELHFKVPARGTDLRLALHVVPPVDAVEVEEARAWLAGEAWVERRTLRRDGGWIGAPIAIDGLAAAGVEAIVRLERLDGTKQVARLTPSQPTFVVAAAPGPWEVTRAYASLGVEHILGGIDHLLFVLALLIVTRGGWKLAKTVTAFTVSHSVTLTAAALGWVHVPPPPVEAVISLSILFVAAEIVHGRRGRPGVTERAPWLVAFTFGLLHGLGFAGGLAEAGLPENHVPLALLNFSLGVEAGHFLFIGAVLAVLAAARALGRRLGVAPPAWGWRVAPYSIGAIAACWTIERIAAFF